MTKITLTNLVNLQNETTAVNAINSNNAILVAAMDNTLSRDGTAPNQFTADQDANNHRILNLPKAVTADEPLRLQELNDFIGGGTVTNIPTGGSTGQQLTKVSATNYDISWQYPTHTGDVTSTSGNNATTIAANAVTNAKAAQMAAFTLKGNSTGSTANAQDLTISGLTSKATPAPTDLVIISDTSASGALKSATVSSVGTSAGISSIDAQTGVFTTGNGIDSSGKVIEMTAARRTLPTIQTLTAASGTYTTPANVQFLKIIVVGAGGGGAGGNGANPSGGGSSTFSGTGLSLSAIGGSGGKNANTGGAGGTATGANFINATGNTGIASQSSTTTNNLGGGNGGAGPFGGAGPGGFGTGSGGGSGGLGSGGGGGGSGTASGNSGSGGGSGGWCIHIQNNPQATYSYTVGSGSGGTSGGTNGGNGGNGGNGIILVEEYYNS